VSAALESRVEVAKLARLLGSAPDELDYLTKARPDDVRRFRVQLTDALFDRDKARFGRLAAPSRILPAQLAATIAERALGPMLCARLSGLIEPEKAVDIAKRLPAPFLAEVAIEMDPRRAKDVIARIPAKLVATVASELADRGETVTMGRFVGYLGDDALAAAIAAMDDFALLETAFVMEGKERLDRILELLTPKRLRAMVATAEQRGLWDETLDLLTLVSPQRRAALVQTALEVGVEGILPSLFAAVDSTGSWESGLRMLAELPPDSKQQLAAYASTLNGTERLRALEQAEALHLIKELGPIGEALKR
jgi:hypothetical protein